MKSVFNLKDYLIAEGQKSIDLTKYPTLEQKNEKNMKQLIISNIKNTVPIQKALYAEAKQSILFVFQAMDAAGKDSTIQKVFSGINPQGVESSSFKKPTSEELAYDYLWRVHKRVPARGNIGIFNRSHYEEVLVTKVHPQYILYQNLPDINSVSDITESFWNERYEALKDFEKQLHISGCKVVKLYLHVSKDEQKTRLLSRMDVPEKNWKVKLQDTLERAHWATYQSAYEKAIATTSTSNSPWYVIPADHKWTMRGIVSTIILEEMRKLNPQFPGFSEKDKVEMEEARKILLGE